MHHTEFRKAAHRVADLMADYLWRLESFRVLPDISPGDVLGELPPAPPQGPESLDSILEDYGKLIEPNITHWQHPAFLAYFSSVATGPGILGEMLAATLNSNVMFWQNAPASTELEQLIVSWLRQMLGLPGDFDGMLTDTASISSLTSLVAARHALAGLDARDEGLAGRDGLGRLRLYCSEEAHSSIEKAAVVIGVGRAGVRRIPADDEYRMRVNLLREAIAEDRAAGWWPFCVVATLGTTSTTSVDPVAAVADVCAREKLWLHVDAAYAGAAAILPEASSWFVGWERADSIVVNPHKWLFTPFDASLLLFRQPETYRQAFGLVPEYLKATGDGARNYHEYGIQLGRRFRALKLWMIIRYFGVEGIAARLRSHCEMARDLAARVDDAPDWERLAPVPFSTVCLRFRPRELAGREGEDGVRERLDRWNAEILDRVNREGKVYLSHSKAKGRYALRVSIGNPRTTREHIELCWNELTSAAAQTS